MSEQMTVIFPTLPKTLAELTALPQAALTSPQDTAALFLAAAVRFPEDREAAYEMMDFLRGPRPLSQMEKQFIRDRFLGTDAIPRSYFKGAVPGNHYTPDQPYTLNFETNPYSYAEEGYVKLFIRSGGADSPRDIILRKQGSTGKFFLWEQHLLVGIRPADDPWA